MPPAASLEAAPPRPATHRPLVLAALVMAAFMSSIEATIVATAMPSIAATLGGFSLYAWVFSSYLLMQATMTPVFGKLADLYGRKPTLLAGLAIFLVGSVLCGFAPSMGALVAFRLVQGIGAGAVQPLTVIIIGDLYPIEKRARVQGLMSTVWGVSSIAGPLAGGLLLASAGWPWVFWINVPFGIAAAFLAWRYLHEDIEAKQPSVDYVGAGLLFAGVAALTLGLTQGGVWGAGPASGLIALAAAGLVLFVRYERRVREPLMHMELWANPLIRLANTATFLTGCVMIGLITFLPTYVQGVLGASALAAGFSLTGMTLGWPISAVIAGRLLLTLGARGTSRIGGVTLLAGTLVVALGARHGALYAGIGSFLVGTGLGFVGTTFIVSIQSSVGWAQRGVATASNLLMRLLGSTVGAAVFGGLLNVILQRHLDARGLGDTVPLDRLRDLLGEGAAPGAALTPSALGALHDGLAVGLQAVFWGIVALAAIALVVCWRIPDLDRGETPVASQERIDPPAILITGTGA